MYKPRIITLSILAGIAILLGPVVVRALTAPESGAVLGEAMRAGRTPESMPGSDSDYLKDMDHGWDKQRVFAELARALDMEPRALGRMFSRDAVWKAYNRGRNNWVVWTGGNDRLWDHLADHTYGAFDLLKIISSHDAIRYCGNSGPVYSYDGQPPAGSRPVEPLRTASGDAPARRATPYPPGYLLYEDDACEGADRAWYRVGRENRWKYYGLMNEPCFRPPKGGDPKHFGLWLDVRTYGPDCPGDDPFADEQTYPGVKIGARGDGTLPVGSYYGEPTGIVGLRLFPNPDFDEAARARWDPERYYTDPGYFLDRDLVRPYRVGMSCGFCHVGPNPVNPPPDPEKPEWEHMTSNPGAQYAWIDRVFTWNPKARHENFIYQIAHSWLPGTLDTSLVSSDNINNPRTMNAVYSLAARMQMAKSAKEKLSGGEMLNKQLNDFEQTRVLGQFFEQPDTVFTPHVLKDGADSVGVLGALNRVYVNIGLFSEEWLTHFKPLLGGHITPFEIAVAERNSAYWNANTLQTPDLALFFLTSAPPDKLADTPGGEAYLGSDTAQLNEGKRLFAENCAACHSSKQPDNFCAPGETCGDGSIAWNSDAYKDWMRAEVQKPDFLENNFLSTDRRIPVTILQTNACSPLATNGIAGDIWDNFTSTTYKQLPAVGKITVHHPVTGEPWQYDMPGGGRGYTRPASLVSLWSSAPYLLNNSVGNFYGEPSLEARMASFNDSIQKMLWPEKRRVDAKLGDTVPGYIQRTTTRSYLRVPATYLPDPLNNIVGMSSWLPRLFPWAFSEVETGLLELGPIPAGTPVNLVANIQPVSRETDIKSRLAHAVKVKRVLKQAVSVLKDLPKDASDEDARAAFAPLVDPLMSINKCPDYVVNRGHYFGSKLTDEEKWALIEFLKTF
ncbi:hypothetical protein [Breoghania sp. L-A4]|uniref:c-type cytochrome n=1 Tax=Breoghania sp. L-A4 TaxID=2304600 RepID=UPI000E35D416|nr:hypothetical protein [Breoghania sp. L-A4]AXS40304.1 hypothetical protein D1F64_09835 [Breoghania sp. L-A4]